MTTHAAATEESGRPRRLHGALFQPIGDEGRAELVARRLADAITGGQLLAGDRLPSESDLAATLGVAPVTVREALFSLRADGLVVTRRGRNGGSFVASTADPVVFARARLARSSRLALRDLGAHYGALTRAAIELAARRATPSEAMQARARLDRAPADDLALWRRVLDDIQVELVSLSQSARLTREQMRLQAELSPYLRLIETDDAMRETVRSHLGEMIDAVGRGEPVAATAACDALVESVVDALIELHGSLARQ